MPITREKIKLQLDVPFVCTLDDTSAPESHSQYTGTEHRYSISTPDGRPGFVYLPRQGHDAVQRSMAHAGDRIELLKYMRGQIAYYEVKVVSDAVEPPQQTSLRGHYPNGTATNGNGNHANGRNVQPINSQPNPQRGSSHMAQCLCAAVDAAMETMEYARGKGFGLQFTEAQIQDIGVTIFIGDQRSGGVA